METVILEGARTPFGKFGGCFKELTAAELGGIAIRGALKRTGVCDHEIDEVIMGMVLQGGAGQIPSRQAARHAGLPWEISTETINKVCASGMRSITLADQIIRCGDEHIIVAGGMESMSSTPYMLTSARFGQRMGDGKMVDLMIHDGLWCAFHHVHMITHGNQIAAQYQVTRGEQDEWAYRSHQRAVAAMTRGDLIEEIVAVKSQTKNKKNEVIDQDECPRPDTSVEKLNALHAAFSKDGTITAGNAPGVNDGAVALVLASMNKAKELKVKPLAKILAHVSIAMEAKDFPITPAFAIQKLLKRADLTVADIDLFEVNEAFSAVVLANGKILNWNTEKVNVNGGAVALGHPIGASGARILLTLAYELRRRGGGLGVAAICSGAAQGDAVLIRVDP